MKLKKQIAIVLFLLPMALYGQDTIYMDKNHEKTKLKTLAESYRLKRPDPAVEGGKIVTEYYLSGKLKSEYHVVVVLDEKTKKNKDVQEGTFKMWYESGQLKRDIDYHQNKIDGYLTTYWENGKQKRHDLYQEDNVVEGKCYDEKGHETAYYPFHTWAEFTGGEKVMLLLISTSLKCPVDAQKARIRGEVIVHFVIDTTGLVTDIRIKKGLCPSIDKEVMRVISMLTRFRPGETDGEKAPEGNTLPIFFHLGGEAKIINERFNRSSF